MIFGGKKLKALVSTSGSTAVEYALIMALMTIALLGALASTGSGTSDKWNSTANEVSGAMAGDDT